MFSALSKLRDKVPAPARSDVAGSSTVEGNALFEALVCEFHWTALQIGGVVCLMNAALHKDRHWVLRACPNIMPVEALVVSVALKNWHDLGIPANLARAISRIYMNLADARRLTTPVVEATTTFGGAKISPNKLQQLAELWRKLAEDSLDVVQELEPETRWRLTGHYSENAMVLAKFLKGVGTGIQSHVDALGNVSLPVLPQRRREPRFSLLQPCTIHVRNQVLSGFARDVSQNGLGISCKGELRLKEPVVVELRGGRRLKGRIVWNKNGQQGIQFDTPLSYEDPLIST